MIKRECSICGAELGLPLEREIPGISVSHGICRSCLDVYMVGLGIPMKQFLDTLKVPIFIMDQERRIQGANDLGRQLVSKDIGQITGYLGGEVFQCVHASEPGGCGQTLHCRSCVIRNSVLKTFETGEACIHVPACQDLDTYLGPRTVRFLISTEKVDDAVLLFIDDIQNLDGDEHEE